MHCTNPTRSHILLVDRQDMSTIQFSEKLQPTKSNESRGNGDEIGGVYSLRNRSRTSIAHEKNPSAEEIDEIEGAKSGIYRPGDIQRKQVRKTFFADIDIY